MSTDNIESADQGNAEALSSAALARRRILLKGVGKGTAVLAATVPIQTLAGQSLLTFDGKHQCSVSGMHSGVHSTTPSGTAVCGGYSPGWWGQSYKDGAPKHWPPGVNFNAPVTTVFQYFTRTNKDGSVPTLFQVMDPKDKTGQFSSTDEFHWISAWLNALSYSFNFPYSGEEVLRFYNQGPASSVYQDALTFFKDFMETHNF